MQIFRAGFEMDLWRMPVIAAQWTARRLRPAERSGPSDRMEGRISAGQRVRIRSKVSAPTSLQQPARNGPLLDRALPRPVGRRQLLPWGQPLLHKMPVVVGRV